jgi:2OG-Fe(II) oxygenase superfamily
MFAVVAAIVAAVAASLCHLFHWMDTTTSPELKEIEHFLTPEACDRWVAWINAHSHRFSDSPVDDGWFFHRNTYKPKQRTSLQCWLDPYSHPFAMDFSLEAARHLYVCLGLKEDDYYEEQVQVVQYRPGDYFRPHYDERPNPFRFITNGKPTGRYATLLVYLNDDYEGGYTRFPQISEGPTVVQPKKGKAILFRNLNPDNGRCLYQSYHEGTEVLSGKKYVLNLWIHLKNEK